MLAGARGKFAGLLFGIAFASFLVTFAASYLAGFLTRGFALLSENPEAKIWVMDPTVTSADLTTNLADWALPRVRSVPGVRFATPLALGSATVRFPNGTFQSFQIVGVDDATLAGAPAAGAAGGALVLRSPDAVIVASGGTSGKLQTPLREADRWPHDGPHLGVPTRRLARGDVLQVNDRRVVVQGVAAALPRFPPRPLLYTTLSNARRILLPERHRVTFVLVSVAPGTEAAPVARRIEAQTGLRARTEAEFKADTVRWYLRTSEDVGDMTAMLMLAMLVGSGVTGIMLYLFTSEHLKQYAVLKAMGASPAMLLSMLFTQVGLCALLGTGLGVGSCGIVGELAAALYQYPFRMMWFTPLVGLVAVVIISIVAALFSIRPVLKLEPATVFVGR